MRKLLKVVLALLLLIPYVPAALAQESGEHVSIYVQSGAENGNGSLDLPYGSFEEARDHIRQLKKTEGYPSGGVTVYFREGTYLLNEAMEFGEEDSGEEGSPITYRAYRNENVRFVGGISLPIEDFAKVTDSSVISRLDISVVSKVRQLSLSEYGLYDYGEIANIGHSVAYYDYVGYPYNNKIEPQLYFEEEKLNLARWPNDDTVRVKSVTSEVVENIPLQPETEITQEQINEGRYVGDVFVADDECGERMKRWSQAEDPWLYGRLYKEYTDLSVHILGINPETKELNIEWIPQNINKDTRFYVYNLLEELDAPGEWYLNRDTGILYLYPPAERGNVLLVLLDTPMIKLDKVKHVKFSGLTFEGTRDCLITMNQCEDVVVELCELSMASKYGVLMTACQNCGVISSNLHNIFEKGVYGGGGDRVNLISGENYIENCYFHDLYQAVHLSGVGTRVAHNKFERTEYITIRCTGNDHLIEYNEFKNCVTKGSDLGIIYQGKDKANRGTVIRNNFFHEIYPEVDDVHGLNCIYWDDGADGAIIEQNLFVNIDGYALLINGGRDFNVKNNIAVNVTRGVVRHSAFFTLAGEAYDASRAAVLLDDEGYSWLGLPEGVSPDSPAYAKYPHLANILEDEICEPRYNIVKQNACYRSVPWGRIDVTFEQANSFYGCDMEQPYLFEADPGFNDMQAGNYTLKQDAMLYSIYPDFQAPDFANMGMYSPRLQRKLANTVSMCIGSPKAYKGTASVIIDENNDDVTPVLIKDTAYVPIRFLSESYGGEVNWSETDNKAEISLRGKSVTINLATGEIAQNATLITDERAVVINERTFIPLRRVSEVLGKKVEWHDNGVILVGDSETILGNDRKTAEDLFIRLNNR